MPTGTIRYFDPEKGGGFIAPDEGGHDVHLHVREVRQAGLEEVQPNQRVRYELETGRDGQMAATALEVI